MHPFLIRRPAIQLYLYRLCFESGSRRKSYKGAFRGIRFPPALTMINYVLSKFTRNSLPISNVKATELESPVSIDSSSVSPLRINSELNLESNQLKVDQ